MHSKPCQVCDTVARSVSGSDGPRVGSEEKLAHNLPADSAAQSVASPAGAVAGPDEPRTIERPAGAGATEKPTLGADLASYVAALPPGFRGLYSLVWFCRTAQKCSTALRLRAFLCSLYNGNTARKVDLSDVQCFDGAVRRDFVEVLLHLGSGTGLYDHHIREAFRAFGIERYFEAGFPRRKNGGES